MAVSSLSITSVNLYSEAARAGRGERRQRDAAHECAPCPPKASDRSGSALADAMRDAFAALGWSRAEETSESAGSAPQASSDEGGPSLDDAVAGFASALAQALKDVRRGESGGDGCGLGGRRWGHGRMHGMAPRIELLVVQMQAGATAPDAGTPAAPATTITAPAPAPEPMTTDTAPEAATEVAVAVAPAAAATPAVDTEAAAPDATEPLVVTPPPAPEEPGGLVDAFKKLLDSLRDNGVKIPADEQPADSLVRFLNQLAESLRGRTGASRFDTQPVFSGTFVRIVV
jgi:hypothetical protein